jgi:PAS domain S-box-containing protein
MSIELVHIQHATSLSDRLARESFDVLLVDLESATPSLRSGFQSQIAPCAAVPVIVLTQAESLREGLDVMRRGATDYLCKKSLNGSLLARSIRYAVERNRAGRELQASEQRYRQLLEAVTTYTYSVQLQHGVPVSTKHGKGCEATTGYSPGDFAVDPYLWFNMVHPDDRPLVQELVENVLAGKPVLPIEHRIIHRDGTIRWVRDTIVPHCDQQGQLVHYDGLVEDITDRKQLEQRLRYQEAQMLAAQEIQRQFLPDGPPMLPGYDVAAVLYPAEFASGDLFDFLPMLDGTTALVVGDVSGHGVGPALLMASTHVLLRTLVLTYADAAKVMTLANTMLCRETRQERFVTSFLGCLNAERASFQYVSAGHSIGYIMNSRGEIKTKLHGGGLPLGIRPNMTYTASEPLPLDYGDLIVLFTDGILEARSGEDKAFGTTGVLETIRDNLDKSACDLAETLCNAARRFSKHEKLLDDVTVMVLKVKQPPDA